jgi:chromosome segregation ATPase
VEGQKSPGGIGMKVRSQAMEADGFDKSVAEKMPRIKRLEEPLPSDLEKETQPLKEDHHEVVEEMRSSERETERRVLFEPPKKAEELEQDQDVLRLIEDLHTQLLVSSRAKKALEIDQASHQKTIRQLAQDNKDLRKQLEDLSKELQGVQEIHSESVYLREENEEALERIKEFQQELRDMKETLAKTTQEKDEALNQLHELESQIEQNECFKIKGKMRERETSHFYEENRELQSKLEEALAQNMDLEEKYESLKKSFNEIKESLTFLRDSCKKSYYNLSEAAE